MVGIVTRSIGVRAMKPERLMSLVRMLADVIVGKVPEDADRLGRDQHHDGDQHDDESTMGRETANHRHSLSSPAIHRGAG